MKLEDMILVTENRKGTESIFLLNLSDYMEMVIRACEDSAVNMAGALAQLYDTREGKSRCSELYFFREDTSSQAVFCTNEAQLQCFLFGQQDGRIKQEKPVFEEARCTSECFEVLKAYGIDTDGHSLFHSLHYEAVEHDFRQGEILHNLNGSDYRVLSVLNEENLLLMSQSNGQFIVAVNTVMYERTPKEEHLSADSIIRGIEWGHGIYLGNDLMKMNLQEIQKKYGTDRVITTVDECRDETRRQFSLYQQLSKDGRLAFTVQWAAEESLRNVFGTTDDREFEKRLLEGCYDFGIKAAEEKRQEEKIKKSK